ncbi:uncharacterized protein FTOL_07268 [Fusarium torulosum]|uniref:NmrA-like domain-containing protein n=1 Tax=Fusarium torulosum TaxID=33205 RepID=A0AAE8SJI4_9HYPO|nr:uncharacterized protein FTOL_07268 [Fusarium torulosum]
MSVIAVAGGTGGVGRAIIDALNATGKFEVVILSRKPSKEKEQEFGSRIVTVDYENIPGLAKVLEENKIGTVISTLEMMAGPGPEEALIRAADKSTITKRYIPSIWGVPYSEETIKIFPAAKWKIECLELLKTSSLEYTAIYNGLFLDYFVAPVVPTYLSLLTVFLDITNNAAAIPGTGNVTAVFTHTWDIARFVAAYVGKAKWVPEAYIFGDKATLNELLKVAEDAKGVKFTVSYDSLEDLAAGRITELPSHLQAYPFFPKPALQGALAGMGLMLAKGVFNMHTEWTLNQEFPDIKPRTIEQLMNEAWGTSQTSTRS